LVPAPESTYIAEPPAEHLSDELLPIPWGPADDTSLGDGSDYPDRAVIVYYPYPGRYGSDITDSAERPAEDLTDKPWTISDTYLSIAVSGSTDQITRIKSAEGGATYNTDIEKLIQAMASFAPLKALQTSWTSGQTITGNILLAVSH